MLRGCFYGLTFLAASTCLNGWRIASAEIYKWEYINPQNPAQGKKESNVLAPGGAGRFAGPGAYLTADLTMGYLHGANLRNALFEDLSNVTNADFSQANLTGAAFRRANITSADFTGADVRGTSFQSAIGLTAAQIYSTASYAAGDLSGIILIGDNLSGWNLAGKNLTGASLWDANLTGADFTGANIRAVVFRVNATGPLTPAQLYSTASYQAKDLTGVNFTAYNLSGWNFAAQNLTFANFGFSSAFSANLAGAVFTGAIVRGASFEATVARGFTSAQFYSTSSYQTGDLTGVRLSENNLTGWNFANQDLTNARFQAATLTGAVFNNAKVSGGSFYWTTDKGFTAAQLYATTSYQQGDLAGINLGANDLTGWNFAGRNLTGGRFDNSTLANADFSGATVRGVDFSRRVAEHGFTHSRLASTVSYQAHDLRGVNFSYNTLDGWNFSGQNLCGSSFHDSTLTGVDFSNAIIKGADLQGATARGFSAQTLYSTASYQQGDLSGITLSGNMNGWNLAQQNLDGASFSFASFNGTDLSGANLMNTYTRNSSFSGANLTAADFRGTHGLNPAGATVTNTIFGNGEILGLDLSGARSITVRDHDGNANSPLAAGPGVSELPGVPEMRDDYHTVGPIAIRVRQQFKMQAGSILQMVLEEDAWDSQISFDPGIPVMLGGNLKLDFATDADITSQFGRTFQLFNWSGVSPIGQFTIDSQYAWDTSLLYSNGTVALLLPGDFNNDGSVDAADYVIWRKGLNTTYTHNDYNLWRSNFGRSAGSGTGTTTNATVPEPSGLALLLAALVLVADTGALIRR